MEEGPEHGASEESGAAGARPPEPAEPGADLLLLRLYALADSSDRYRTEAYVWVLRILEETRRWLERAGHISGRELVEGNRRSALEHFGPMARQVLGHWGIETTEDIGRLVFELVEADILKKTDEDTLDDFRDAYDFEQALERDYRF